VRSEDFKNRENVLRLAIPKSTARLRALEGISHLRLCGSWPVRGRILDSWDQSVVEVHQPRGHRVQSDRLLVPY
jgi:hypothetical protein